MEADFWHNRWENNLTGFHLDEVNPNLKDNWSIMNLDEGSRVFVPLCGKSIDLVWLASQGHQVVGSELSQLAVEAFFAENELVAKREKVGNLEYWQSEQISIFCGDIFDLTAETLGKVDAVYDRASLIALPPQMRTSYAAKLTELAQSAPKFLVTLEYDQGQMGGPPFSVSEEEVNRLYQEKYHVSRIAAQDVLTDNPNFVDKGLDYMNECVYQLQVID